MARTLLFALKGGNAEQGEGMRAPRYGRRDILHPNFESRFSRQSRPSRLSQASAIAAEAFMNNAG